MIITLFCNSFLKDMFCQRVCVTQSFEVISRGLKSPRCCNDHVFYLFVYISVSARQYCPDTGGHHYSEGSQSEQLSGGDDGQEYVCQCPESKTK